MNANLNGIHQRNLEADLGLPVMDRRRLIIEIFAKRARTREARLQVGAVESCDQAADVRHSRSPFAVLACNWEGPPVDGLFRGGSRCILSSLLAALECHAKCMHPRQQVLEP